MDKVEEDLELIRSSLEKSKKKRIYNYLVQHSFLKNSNDDPSTKHNINKLYNDDYVILIYMMNELPLWILQFRQYLTAPP